MFGESEPIVAHSIAQAMGKIAKFELREHRWFELPQLVNACCTQGSPAQRTVGTYLLE